MHHRRVVVGLAVIAVALLVGVQLLDPLGQSPDPTPVDLSAPPSEIAVAALSQPETGDYTLDIRYTDGETGSTGHSRILVEQSAGEVLVRGAILAQEPPVFRRYVTPDVGWRGYGPALERWPASYGAVVGEFENVDVLRNRTVKVVRENASRLVLAVNGTDAVYSVVYGEPAAARDEDPRARMRVHVDRDTARLRRIVVVESRLADPPENQTRVHSRLELVYSDWGTTEVRRPPAAGYTLAEFLYDLLDNRP